MIPGEIIIRARNLLALPKKSFYHVRPGIIPLFRQRLAILPDEIIGTHIRPILQLNNLRPPTQTIISKPALIHQPVDGPAAQAALCKSQQRLGPG